jgi:hypothetical protein
LRKDDVREGTRRMQIFWHYQVLIRSANGKEPVRESQLP